MRTFTRIRAFLLTHTSLQHKLDELERKYDSQFKSVFDAIKALMSVPPSPGPKKISGFKPEN